MPYSIKSVKKNKALTCSLFALAPLTHNQYIMTMRDLLFEIGTEEIPAGFLSPALEQLKTNFIKKTSDLKISHGSVKTMGTPRRLALLVFDLANRQADSRDELLGPSKEAGFDGEGNPTKAAYGFARSKGADVGDLSVVQTPKGEYLMLVREVKGVDTFKLLPEILKDILLGFSFPKSMRWGSNLHSFARPIQWLTAIHGDQVVPFEHDGIETSNMSRGHRFMDGDQFIVKSAFGYESQLVDKQVLVDPARRRLTVVEEINRAVQSSSFTGGSVAIDENLVDTVTNLVEMPLGICGRFDKKFLQLPAEVLITSMREHQKYFPVVNDEGELLAGFVAVNNTRVNDDEITRKGHQRVLRARLEDALFFFESDRATRLEDRVQQLDGIIFQAKLGTMLEKKERMVKLAGILADKVDPSLKDTLCRSALLCKADLLSDMVGEFPSLQGIMGGAYALLDGEDVNVATAIKEHYMPKRAGAEPAATDAGALLGLVDRFDTLVGCFGIGLTPTGTADPFGLRRITLAILHTIENKSYSISLREIVHKALALYGDKVDGSAHTVDTIVTFIKGRFINDCVKQGMSAEVVDAAVSVAFDDTNDCLLRINALAEIQKEPAFKVLAASYKRVKNIIKENRETEVDTNLFEHKAEGDLHTLFKKVSLEMEGYIRNKEYDHALGSMLKMKEVVDTFFDEVMVMASDPAIRRNRLNLLTGLGNAIRRVGDIAKMQDI